MEDIRIFTYNTVVIGSGAAGFNAAGRLHQYGQTDTAIVTEEVNNGTSRNTGSDKQTYYKLTLSGSDPDSVREMTDSLFAGQCVDGDNALCEAALSVPSFLRLVELGVPFPRNRWGEYIGYKTDHDPRRRATSVGPYTSRMMTEALERSVRAQGVPIYDHMQAIRLLSDGRRVFLDFRTNPGGRAEIDYSALTDEARAYLEKAGACFGTPLQRLRKMNEPAVDFYAGKGVDLAEEMLEIALCAQHNNGGAAFRRRESIAQALGETEADLQTYEETVRVTGAAGLAQVFRLKDILLCQRVYLSAMLHYIDHGGKSRGSALYSDPDGSRPYSSLPEEFTYSLDKGNDAGKVQETWLDGERVISAWRPVRPIPEDDDFFENVWRDFCETGNIF